MFNSYLNLMIHSLCTFVCVCDSFIFSEQSGMTDTDEADNEQSSSSAAEKSVLISSLSFSSSPSFPPEILKKNLLVIFKVNGI